MKNSLYSNREVESLRTQVRELHQSVAELESRLAAVEIEAESDEDRWGVWPYCTVVATWDFVRAQFHRFHRRLGKWDLQRHNRRYRLQNDGPTVKMRLT